jgi:hypothetical protein
VHAGRLHSSKAPGVGQGTRLHCRTQSAAAQAVPVRTVPAGQQQSCRDKQYTTVQPQYRTVAVSYSSSNCRKRVSASHTRWPSLRAATSSGLLQAPIQWGGQVSGVAQLGHRCGARCGKGGAQCWRAQGQASGAAAGAQGRAEGAPRAVSPAGKQPAQAAGFPPLLDIRSRGFDFPSSLAPHMVMTRRSMGAWWSSGGTTAAASAGLVAASCGRQSGEGVRVQVAVRGCKGGW